MTAIGPYTQSYDYTFMYNIPDLRGTLPVKANCPGTISDILATNTNFSLFYYTLKKAGLEGIYDALQANCTLFVPADRFLNPDIFINIDRNTARTLINSSTLDRFIPSELLEDSPASFYLTRNPYNKLFISNLSGQTYINNCIRVVQKDIMCKNGIIHVVDGLLDPVFN